MGRRYYTDIEVRGRVFPTAQAAAAHFGVQPQTVLVALRKGTLHRLGTGAVGAEPCPIRIRGTLYPSAKAAARALGVNDNTISVALARGTLDRVGLPRRDAWNAAPITLGGVRFPSRAAADRALGFPVGYVWAALKRRSPRAMERIVAAAMAHVAQAERRAA